MLNKFMKNGSASVMVVSDKGRQYSIEATIDPAIYGDKEMNLDKKKEAENKGKQYIFNVKMKQWQTVKIVSVHVVTDDGLFDEWVPFEIYKRKHPVRMSLEQAINILETVMGAKVEIVKKRESAEDPRYRMVDSNNEVVEFKTGFEVVRMAKGIA